MLLGALLAIEALLAFGGAFYGLSGADGVPLEWLRGSPFKTYLVPSLILLIAVGGSFLIASVATFWRLPADRRLALSAVLILFVWLAAQLAIIGYVSWMQAVTGFMGALQFLLAWKLPVK